MPGLVETIKNHRSRGFLVVATAGPELGLTPRTWQELTGRVVLPSAGSRDAILKIDTRYGFGFSRPSRDMPFGSSPSAFGCPGAGGSFGMADPTEQLGFAFLTNKMGFRLFDDPREKAVRDACYASVAAIREKRIAA